MFLLKLTFADYDYKLFHYLLTQSASPYTTFVLTPVAFIKRTDRAVSGPLTYFFRVIYCGLFYSLSFMFVNKLENNCQLLSLYFNKHDAAVVK